MSREWSSLSSDDILEMSTLKFVEGELSESRGLLREAIGGGLLTATGVLLLPGQQSASEIIGVFAGVTYCTNKFKDLFKFITNPVKPFLYFDGQDVLLAHCGSDKDMYTSGLRGRAPWGTFQEASWTADRFFRDLTKPDAEVFKTPKRTYYYRINDMLSGKEIAKEAFYDFGDYLSDCLVRLRTTLLEIGKIRRAGYISKDGLVQLTASPGLISNSEILYAIECMIFLNGLSLFMIGSCNDDILKVSTNLIAAQNSLNAAILGNEQVVRYRLEKLGTRVVKNGYKFAQCGFSDINDSALNLPHALWWVHEMLFQDRPVWATDFERGFFLLASQRAGVFGKEVDSV